MAQMKKNPVSGKTVKTTTYNLLTPFKKTEKVINERTTRKPVAKTTSPAPKKPAPMGRFGPMVKQTDKPNPMAPRTPSTGVKKPLPKTITVPIKRKPLVMPDKISPSKMTPAQKARYLKNPERYDG